MPATMQIPESLASRKLWMTIAACLTTLGGMISGAVQPSEGFVVIGMTVGAYLLAQGHVDATTAKAAGTVAAAVATPPAAAPTPEPALLPASSDQVTILISQVQRLTADLSAALKRADREPPSGSRP